MNISVARQLKHSSRALRKLPGPHARVATPATYTPGQQSYHTPAAYMRGQQRDHTPNKRRTAEELLALRNHHHEPRPDLGWRPMPSRTARSRLKTTRDNIKKARPEPRLPSGSTQSHQAGVPADAVPLGDLVGLQEVPVRCSFHIVQGVQVPVACRREHVGVGESPRAVLDLLHPSGVVGVRGAIQELVPVTIFGEAKVVFRRSSQTDIERKRELSRARA